MRFAVCFLTLFAGCTVRVWGTDFAPPGPRLLCWPTDDSGKTWRYALDDRLIDKPAPASSVLIAVPFDAPAPLLARCYEHWLRFADSHPRATRHLVRACTPLAGVRTNADLDRYMARLKVEGAIARLMSEQAR